MFMQCVYQNDVYDIVYVSCEYICIFLTLATWGASFSSCWFVFGIQLTIKPRNHGEKRLLPTPPPTTFFKSFFLALLILGVAENTFDALAGQDQTIWTDPSQRKNQYPSDSSSGLNWLQFQISPGFSESCRAFLEGFLYQTMYFLGRVTCDGPTWPQEIQPRFSKLFRNYKQIHLC